ncbi:PP2C family protein-serine/threonine phosphatase [Glaciecola sp. 1036]|uniref:PP2C family protein-serine/threonine phosphatase n=1 Tax=Alteromonadaceae TaxID=72275 RepID=UPI003D01AA14
MAKNNWVCVSKTDIGTVRKVNEDALLDGSDYCLWCVADGMGGHEKGDLASSRITEHLFSLVKQVNSELNLQLIERCVQEINFELIQLAERQQSVVGSTVAILFIQDQKAHCIWAGDSRIYRIRNNQLLRLTRDHSQVEDMIDAGLISQAEAETHPKANVITRAVGAHDQLQLEICSYDIEKNDQFILCSDGLNKVMTDKELSTFVQQSTFEEVAEDLIDIALQRNARDNVTVLVVKHKLNNENSLRSTLPLDRTLPLHS